MQHIIKALNESSFVTITNELGSIVHASQLFCAASGYREEELLGKNHDILSSDIHDAAFWSEIFHTLPHQNVWRGEIKIRTKQGGELWLSTVIHPFMEEDRYAIQYLALHQDITERKRAESELILSREKYQSLVMNIPGITYRCKMDADWTMLFLSRQVDIITGYAAEEILGNRLVSYGKLIHADDQEPVNEAVEQGISQNEPWEIEYRVKHKNGSIRWVFEKGRAVFDEHGEIAYLDGFILDITDRKLIEQENLRQKENLVRIGQLARVGGWEYDVRQDKLTWTPVTYDIHEMPYDFIPDPKTAIGFYKEGQSRDTITQVFRDALEHGTAYDVELVICTASGSERWVRTMGEPIRSQGEIVGLTGVFQDIHQRKQAECALEVERIRLSGTIEGTHVGTWEWNVQTGDVVFNERWAEIIGYTLAEISPVSIETWMRFAHPEDLLKSNEQLELHFRRQLAYYDFETRMKHKNGEWVWVQDRGKVISWTDDGKPLIMLGTHQDISERKKIEKEKEYQMTLLKALFEESTVGIALNDMETGAFLDVNDKLLEPTGYTKEEFLSLTYWEITPEEYLPQEERALREMKEKGLYSSWEKEYIRKDGGRYPIRLNGVVVDGLNGKKCIWSIVEDITERRLAEEALVSAKEQAIAGSRAKSEFLANMSHEIRTPLNGVIGFTELLKNTNLTEEQQQYVDSANVSGHALLGIISDILDFSKIEAGMLHLESIRTDLVTLLEESIDIVKFQAATKNLELLMDIDPAMPRFASTDPVRLKQVLTNLLSNAVKFTEKGEVELKVRYEDRTHGRGALSFDVRDTGIGITDEQIDKLFRAFSQADSSTTRKFGGTGLGLIISDLIIKEFGGVIHVDSAWGEGTTFRFELVMEMEPAAVVDLPPFDLVKRCLIIDDNKNSCRILQEILASHGIASECCHNGVAALKILDASSSFDAILCDYHMPYFSGGETIRKIRTEMKVPAEKLPIVLLHTSVEDAELHSLCAPLGVPYKLTKPVKKSELVAMLRHINSAVGKAKETAPPVHHEPWSPLQGSIHILIAEDVRTNLVLLKLLIGKMYPMARFIEAHNGHETLRLARECSPDLIFMDVQMPEMDGLEATQKIRALEEGRRVPIIALTAGALKEEREKCLAAGMDEFLTKPIEKEKIRAVLMKYLPLQDEAAGKPVP
jgi:PAS domain S-box-containing protein